MRLAVTGTPGTGKTTATDRVETDLDVVHLNELIRREGLYTEVDEDRESVVADLDAVATRLEGLDDIIVDSHLSHYLEVEDVVVLRCEPGELERRLRRRGASAAKAAENAESEALDVILSEAVQGHGEDHVYEVDTTDRSPEEVAEEIERILQGDVRPSAGTVDFTGYL
ncbi:Broad-specificity NMP kinase [Halanaeroarchaeum sp. HSR-CO]|uniref:adenylate kinase family protein n=1 Tax=Halanaeroarchaeum sp. HSR-CO TaxID=2866382 RepID=UPI00217EC7AE|nr:AAA family ATPase [Halanaeroarchaeum sp. HSR-CO]UWG48073.1 Broad-specificity NMP kinase [Halanaeroarchaeum sp. HSR-CO]